MTRFVRLASIDPKKACRQTSCEIRSIGTNECKGRSSPRSCRSGRFKAFPSVFSVGCADPRHPPQNSPLFPLSYSLGYEMPIPSPKVPLELHMLRSNWWGGSYFEWTP